MGALEKRNRDGTEDLVLTLKCCTQVVFLSKRNFKEICSSYPKLSQTLLENGLLAAALLGFGNISFL